MTKKRKEIHDILSGQAIWMIRGNERLKYFSSAEAAPLGTCGDGVGTEMGSRAEMVQADGADPETLVQVGILMERLEKQNAETARIVDLDYFVGFTVEEIAEITGLTFRPVRHHWERGRDWLKDGLRG